MPASGGCVRPGLHRPRVGAYTVAWWDPNLLALEAEESVGIRQQRILEADETGTEVARGEQSYNQWRESRAAAIGQATRPSIKVQTATAFAAAAGLSEADLRRIQIETVSRADIERPSGRRFGALVHAVLAAVDLDANADKIAAVAQANARLLDATASEIEATVRTIQRALEHPLLQRAARAKVLRRETPVQHYRQNDTLIEGVVDLAFQETTLEFDGWIVVDFKTDREIEKAETQYRAQVAAYVEAIRVATACQASGFLLVV
jgi:hypothetical protein